MARIRTIKPEFPQSESVGALSRDARLLFIMLWTIVDDVGRTRASSRMLSSLLYPYDDDAKDLIEGWLGELESGNQIRRYEVSGSQYLEIVKWLEHQKIDHPSKSRLPSFDEASRVLAKPSRSLAPDLVPSTLDLVPSIGSEAGASGAASPPPTKPKQTKGSRGSRLSADWSPCEADRLAAKAEGFSDFEINREAMRFRDYWIARAGAGGVKLDWSATWRNWVRSSAEKLGKQPQQSPTGDSSGLFLAKFGSEELDAWDSYTRKKTGQSLPRNKDGHWHVPCQWPPGYRPQVFSQAAPPVPQLKSMGGLN